MYCMTQKTLKILKYSDPRGTYQNYWHAFQNVDTPHFRFLNSTGRFESDEKLVPFGIGKRFCLGRSLAEKEYFLFFAGILQQFKLENVPGTKPPSYAMEDAKVDGILRIPAPFEIIFKLRDWTWTITNVHWCPSSIFLCNKHQEIFWFL